MNKQISNNSEKGYSEEKRSIKKEPSNFIKGTILAALLLFSADSVLDNFDNSDHVHVPPNPAIVRIIGGNHLENGDGLKIYLGDQDILGDEEEDDDDEEFYNCPTLIEDSLRKYTLTQIDLIKEPESKIGEVHYSYGAIGIRKIDGQLDFGAYNYWCVTNYILRTSRIMNIKKVNLPKLRDDISKMKALGDK